MNRPVPQQAVDIIKKYEGFRGSPYFCPSGKLTIGYGHTANVTNNMTMTEPEACQLLMKDLQSLCNQVISACKITLNNNQLGALLSFAYNCGIGNFLSSTLLIKVNNGNNPAEVVAEFKRWVKDSHGNDLPGLVARRSAEAQLYLS